ncbi:MAG: pyridoxal-phosphate dependent enzyme [Cyanobium sp.]
MTECQHDLSQARLRDSDNPFERYFDLIPVKDRDLLPTAQMTPCVHATRLGQQLGLERLYLKNETANPTGTTKYRMAAVSLPYLYEAGVRHFCTSSTGNSSTAYAVAISGIPGLRMSLFTGRDFQHRVNYHETDQVDHYVLEGASFAEAFEYAGVFAAEHGYTSERGFFNVGRREGLKLAWLEAVEQIPTPIDWYVQGVSSAMGVIGVAKGARELLALGLTSQLPKLLCAQQESCAPMVSAWTAGSPVIRPQDIVRQPSGIAMAILRGDPSRAYPYVYRAVQESGGEIRAATQADILEAQALVRDREGIEICCSAATAVAAMVQRARLGLFRPDETILVNLTGSDRRDAHVPSDPRVMQRSGTGWVAAR